MSGQQYIMSITERVIAIIASEANLATDQITFDTSLKRLSDDYDMFLVRLTMAIEEEFNIEIPDDDVEKWQTVGHITIYAENYAGDNN